MTEHRIRWYVWTAGEKHPRTAGMRGTWGHDAECSCGWQSRTGGAVRSFVARMVADHKWDVANGFWKDPSPGGSMDELLTNGTVIPTSEQHAEALALACEDAQPLAATDTEAEALAARAAFYWALAANWDR